MRLSRETFFRIRHYGLLTNRNRKTRIAAIRKNMGKQPPPEKLEVSPEIKRLLTVGSSTIKCPNCKTGALLLVGLVYPNARGNPTLGFELIVQKRQAV
ncbi:MAG: hypothetical protein LAT76_11465 [Schleiferiaceae bacterium]|nr:hypothetical protein [Schleiferiaceae bacterium]